MELNHHNTANSINKLVKKMSTNKLSNLAGQGSPTKDTSDASPYTPSDGSLGFHHHHKPNLTVQINVKTPIELEAHKIDFEGNIVNSPNTLSDKQLTKMGKKQLKTKLLSHDSLNDEGFHMEIETLSSDKKNYESVVSNKPYKQQDVSLDRLCSIDSMKSAGSVVEVKSILKNSTVKTETQPPKKCTYHQEMDASWICEKCKNDVCELCSMSKMATSNPMICHHCFDERAKNLNMIWLWIGAFCIGIICPPLMVAAPLVIILRSQNEKFKRIAWIFFWVITFGLFFLLSSGLIIAIALKYAGKLN